MHVQRVRAILERSCQRSTDQGRNRSFPETDSVIIMQKHVHDIDEDLCFSFIIFMEAFDLEFTPGPILPFEVNV